MPTTKSGVDVVEDGWPTYVRVIALPKLFVRGTVTAAIVALALLGWIAYQVTVARVTAHADAERLIYVTTNK